MRLLLNIIFSGVIVIVAYESKIATDLRFSSWLVSVMKKVLLLNLVGSLCSS